MPGALAMRGGLEKDGTKKLVKIKKEGFYGTQGLDYVGKNT